MSTNVPVDNSFLEVTPSNPTQAPPTAVPVHVVGTTQEQPAETGYSPEAE